VELTTDTATTYIRHAFDQMLTVAGRLGDERVNRRPIGPRTNAVAALVIHCCEVSEFWLGHVALGRPSERDRDTEFDRTASVQELGNLVGRAVERVVVDLQRLDAGEGTGHEVRSFLPGGDTSDAALVLHVIEELYQHLGHMELAADALSIR
jgi:uncharacterized damage-inducible protein DinB